MRSLGMGLKAFLKKYLSTIVVIVCISIQIHLVLYLLAYNQRGLFNSPLYCGALFAQEYTQGDRELLSVVIEDEQKTDPSGGFEDFEDDDPAGKFRSSFHVGGKHKELIKRLHNSLDLKPQGEGRKQGSGPRNQRGGKRKGGGQGSPGKNGGGFPQVFEDLIPGHNAKQSYIYRKRQHQDIVVKEVLPTLYTIDKPFESILKQAPSDLKQHTDRNRVIEDFRSWLDGDDPRETSKVDIMDDRPDEGRTPLHFPRSERKKYFDSTLTEGKELQLKNFIDKYFHHDPNKGDLPLAIRDLYYENLQRLAYMFSYDVTFFMIDYFQENLNKEDFLKHSLAKVSELRKTKAATELLFAIENIYDIQQRATKLLLDFSKKYQELPNERKNRLRTETLKRVMERYRPLLKQKKILNQKDSFQIYAKRRLEIMDYLIKQTPRSYRVKDALFEKGRIYWELGKMNLDASQYEKAIRVWSKIPTIRSDRGDFLNKDAFEKVWPYLKSAAVRRPEQKGRLSFLPLVNHISGILNSRLQEQLSEKRIREDRLLWP